MCFGHGKQTALVRLPSEGSIQFRNTILSVVKVDRSYAAQRPYELPEFFFYGVDTPAKEGNDIDWFLFWIAQEVLSCSSECS